jgi:molybdopterin-containing oxidoreductase family membrane subunit
MMLCNVVSPQIFWFKKMRENLWVVMAVAMCVNIGMWFERFVIIVTTLARMWLPGDWKTYSPSGVDVLTFVGTIGMFLALFLLFLRFLPCINIAEVKWTLKESDAHDEDKKAHPDDGIELIPAYQYELHENPEGAAKEAGIEIEKSTAES